MALRDPKIGRRSVVSLALLLAGCASGSPGPAPQNPSPMVDSTRVHERVERKPFAGETFQIDGILPKPVEVFANAEASDLLIHFHGASFIVADAATRARRPMAAASVHLGAGSRVYETPFLDPEVFPRLLDAIRARTGNYDRIWLTGFSAGYGAIRAILRDDDAVQRIDGVLLLDGLHTGYLQDRRVEEEKMQPFVRYARLAAEGKKTFVVTHSEVFPGTFASTTETTDHLLAALGIKRRPLLAWGAVGMQQLSAACAGRFLVLGFAGNSAPDHLDHLHGMASFVDRLFDPPPCSVRE